MRIKVSNLFLISSVMSFVFMVFVLVITYVYFDKYQQSVKLLNNSDMIVSIAEDMIDISVEMDLYLDMYRATKHVDYLTEYYNSRQRFDTTLNILHGLVKEDFQQENRIILIQAIFSQWEEQVLYYTLGHIQDAQKAKEVEIMDDKLHQDLKIQITDFISDEYLVQRKRKGQQMDNLIAFLTILPTLLVFLGVLLFTLNMYLTRLINKPIKKLVTMAHKLSNKEFDIEQHAEPHIDPILPEPIELTILHKNFVEMAGNLKHSYSNLEELNNDLKAMNKTKDEFIAMVSHELRTPLNAIIGFSELLLDPDFGELSRRQSSYVEDIRTAGVHQLAIINDLLDLAKIESGKMELQLGSVNPKEVIESVIATVQDMAGRGNIELVEEIPSSIPDSVLLDERKFKQILINLLSNAIKFTPANKKVGIKAFYDGFHLGITVWDEGIGISKENQDKIFQKFAQIDSELSRRYAGTGLGLPLVKALVALQNGTMELESEEGKGSSFTVTIPVVDDRDNKPQDDNTVQTRILVITNDNIISSELEKYLTDISALVLVAETMEGTNEALAANRVDIIILDIPLSNGLGWLILQNIKSNPNTSGIPLITISTDQELHTVGQFGVSDYVTKPIDRDILIAAIQRNLAAKNGTDAKTILIIDDDPMVHKLFEGVLNPAQYNIHHAGSGEEGVKIAYDLSPDLVILDIIMPRVNGFDVLDKLKANHYTKDIPVIVLTSKDLSADEIDMLRRHNAPEHFTKGEMINKIVEAIGHIKK